MTRLREMTRCAKCGQAPKTGEGGSLTCGCGNLFSRKKPHRGSLEDEELLRSHGVAFVQDCGGDVYYTGLDANVWLYPDGTWAADIGPDDAASLEDFLKRRAAAYGRR